MKKNKEPYTIEEIFRKKMENHEVQADFSDWDTIRKQIPQQTPQTKKWRWIGSGIAASIALFIISLYTIDQTKESPSFTQYPLPVQQEEKIIEQDPVPFVAKQEKTTEEIESHKPNKTIRLAEINQSPNETNHSIQTTPEENKDQMKVLQMNPETPTETSENKDTSEKIIDLHQQKTTHTATIKSKKNFKKNKQKWVLVSSLGTNSAIPDKLQYDFTEKTPLPPSFSNEVWAGWGGGYQMDTNEESNLLDSSVDVTHLPPFSFGLTARKQINHRLGIETGLIYTYLSSTYKWHEGRNRESTQQLHYLGIPLNGIITIWDNSKWSNYVSAGVTMEKGIRRKITNDEPQMLLRSEYDQNKSIKGLQWSISSSIGFNYHLSKKINIYFEPRVSYFFKNNQPRSIRTDSPVSFGFGMGIQYSL